MSTCIVAQHQAVYSVQPATFHSKPRSLAKKWTGFCIIHISYAHLPSVKPIFTSHVTGNVKRLHLVLCCITKLARCNFGPLTAEIGWQVWDTQQISTSFVLGFVTAVTSLTGSQPNFAQCLAISRAGTLYIHFQGLLPLTEFCQVQNSLCIQVLCSPILAALLHGTPAVGVSQTLRRCTRNKITELLQRAPPIFGWAAITLDIGPHSTFTRSFCFLLNSRTWL